MDNSDLPLVVAEMLIEIQQFKARVSLLEDGFLEVRDGLLDIRQNVRETHQEILGQSGRLHEILLKVQAVLRERSRPENSLTGSSAEGGRPDAPSV